MDTRIKCYYNSEKMGPGGSRNKGMSYAKGKYVLFVDSDDWLDLDSIEKLVKYAENLKTQILMFKGINYDDSRDKFFKTDYYDIKTLNNYEYMFFDIMDIPSGPFYICDTPWNKLYLKTFLQRINANFPEKSIHEDNPFFFKTIIEAKKIYLINEYYYNRRRRKGSITDLKDYHVFDKIDIVEYVINIFLEAELWNKYKTILINFIISQFIQCYERIENKYHDELFIHMKMKIYRFMFDYDLYDDFTLYLNKDYKNFYDNLVNSDNYKEFGELIKIL